jgi:hypothetical protein
VLAQQTVGFSGGPGEDNELLTFMGSENLDRPLISSTRRRKKRRRRRRRRRRRKSRENRDI